LTIARRPISTLQASRPLAGGALALPGFGTANAEAMLNIPPAAYAMGTAAAYTTNGYQYLANGADLVISNSTSGTNLLGGGYTPKGTNIAIYYQDGANSPYLQPLTPDFYTLKTGGSTNYVSPLTSAGKDCTTNVLYAGWSFATNVAFWDYRESDTVQALQIDVSKLNVWLTNSITNNNGGGSYNSTCQLHKGHPIDSIWAFNYVPLNNNVLPAVRLINGQQLPSSSGFSVVTPMPIYVYGNYNSQTNSISLSSGTNTSYTYPAALMGDAITILSPNWSDSYNSSTPLASRTTSSTTVNAAMLEGIVQSSGANYSGGVENFLRFLEDWKQPSQQATTYNGSIVVMFPSIYATNFWQSPGGSGPYDVPTRNWGFDVNFLQQQKLPPLTPQLKKTIRVSWSAM
jgi:hypothetical protein